LPYLTSTHFLPNLDPTIAPLPATTIAANYAAYLSAMYRRRQSALCPFRPRFYATFWPATSQVFVRAVGENGLSTELERRQGEIEHAALWNQTDLAAAWPLNYRESDPTRRLGLRVRGMRFSRETSFVSPFLGPASSGRVLLSEKTVLLRLIQFGC
jgi:hypothetical protein